MMKPEKDDVPTESMYAEAATYLFVNNGGKMTVKQAMNFAGFSERDCKIEKHRSTIRRRKRKLIEQQSKRVGLPPSSIILKQPPTPVSVVTEASSTSDLKSVPSASNKPTNKIHVKRRRRSNNQKLQDERLKVERRKREDDAYFEAVTSWEAQLQLPTGLRTKSCGSIVRDVNETRGTNISYRTVLDQVKEGKGDQTPKRGRPSTLRPEVYDALRSAISTYVLLSNAEMMKKPNRKKLIASLTACLNKTFCPIKRIDFLFERIAASIADDMEVSSFNEKVEHRRLIWSTYDNIYTWFDTLKNWFIEHGFARARGKDEEGEGELVYFPGQLERILNIDESEVSTDGTTKMCGGRPVTEYSPTDCRLPKGANSTNKAGIGSTFIGGSTIKGWPIPPHFQMQSDAKEENKGVKTAFFKDMESVRGRFGFDKVTKRGVTVNSNKKGGMDAVEFAKYLKASIVPLYPDARDEAGFRVAILVDSGPGRLNTEMLAEMKLLGFYLLPGVPNTTHITQPTDQNYGRFKDIYRTNLTKLTEHRERRKATIKQGDVPLLVFGGLADNVDIDLQNAFSTAFSFERNQEVWKK